MKRNKGFTVIEVLITLAVAAIFLGLVLNMGRSTMQRASFTAAINQFVADFYYARQLASRQNRYVAFIFSDDGMSYEIVVQRDIETFPTADPGTYVVDKAVTPLGENEEFFDPNFATDFAVNSTGAIRAFPVIANTDTIGFAMAFFRKYGDTIDYQKVVRVYPSGGIKIEDRTVGGSGYAY